MTEFEKFVDEKIANVIPKYEKLEVRANISDTAYSVEFFVTVDGDRKQNYEMVDNEEIAEDTMDKLTEDIAKFYRKTPEYVSGKVNNVSFVITK